MRSIEYQLVIDDDATTARIYRAKAIAHRDGQANARKVYSIARCHDNRPDGGTLFIYGTTIYRPLASKAEG